MRKIKFLMVLVCAILLTYPAFAVEDEDERYPTIAEPLNLSEMIKEPVENLELEFFAGSGIGYDDNIFLDHYDKVTSFFTETLFSAEAKYPMPVWDWIKLKLGYDLTHILYFRNSDADLFDNIVKGGIETILFDIFTLDVEYNLDFVKYPKDKQGNYLGNQVEAGIKYDITDWLYHRLGYQFLYKDFDRRKTWNRLLTIQLGDRRDRRHTFESEAGLTLFDSTLLKVSNKLYFNNSNDEYLDYYDYYAYKITSSLIQIITDKLSGRASFGYQRKSYDGRDVSDKNEAERDHLFIYGGSLLYDITPALSAGLNYTYRRNFSNENDQQYAGSIISTGIYYSF